MTDFDALLLATAKHQWNTNKWGTKIPDDIQIIDLEFEGWVGCYSSYTCEYGVEAILHLSDGSKRVTSSWSIPQAIKDMAEYDAAWDEMQDDHDSYHGWD